MYATKTVCCEFELLLFIPKCAHLLPPKLVYMVERTSSGFAVLTLAVIALSPGSLGGCPRAAGSRRRTQLPALSPGPLFIWCPLCQKAWTRLNVVHLQRETCKQQSFGEVCTFKWDLLRDTYHSNARVALPTSGHCSAMPGPLRRAASNGWGQGFSGLPCSQSRPRLWAPSYLCENKAGNGGKKGGQHWIFLFQQLKRGPSLFLPEWELANSAL